jgi:hypothetical protein
LILLDLSQGWIEQYNIYKPLILKESPFFGIKILETTVWGHNSEYLEKRMSPLGQGCSRTYHGAGRMSVAVDAQPLRVFRQMNDAIAALSKHHH